MAPVITPAGTILHSVNPRHAHNLFLQLLTCNGIVGLGTFMWVLWQVVNNLRRHMQSWRTGLLSWPVICITIGLTGWNIYDPFYTTLIFYFLAIIIISTDNGTDGRPLPIS